MTDSYKTIMSHSTNEILKTSMKINGLIYIHPNGLRSIQVENDLGNETIAQSYTLTSQSRACLARILQHLKDPSYGRSWTLTGPFGSGKSFFSLYLMNLVCANQPAHQQSFDQLMESDPVFAEQIISLLNFPDSPGLFPVPITGFRGPFQECLQHGFTRALSQLGNSQDIIELRANLSSWSSQTDSRAIVQWLDSLRSKITAPPFNYNGILLVLDEMGKPLEYTASHVEDVDVYLLQEIAEYANRSADHPVVFIGILHQAFERYAAMLDQTTQREWAKVQGRFEDIPFQEPPTQQIRLLVNSLQYTQPERIKQEVPFLSRMVSESIAAGWCPPLMKEEEFQQLCERAYPFHPSTLVALPYIFKRLAQNERSIFAFLTSFEPFGFQEFLHTSSTPTFLRLPDLFNYITANFQGRLYTSNRARALTETLERLSTITNLSPLEIDVLKTIGLLNWLGEVSPVQASERLLSSALVSEKISYASIRQALASLKKRSAIVFRKHNRSYAIWQGSDVDLDERLEEASRRLSGTFSLAEAVQRYLPPRPLIARRHSFQTGTLRFFEVRYIDISVLAQTTLTPKPGASGLILLCLASNPSEIQEFLRWAKQPEFQHEDGVLVGITKRTARLSELLFDLRCYRWIEENTPELRDDKVAQKELFTRINSLETMIQTELDQSVSLHRLTAANGCIWMYKGQPLVVAEKEQISQILSQICDQRFSSSPIIWNELINRRTLSSQSAAARRNLIEAMLTRSHLPQMGIEGYPPERSMYESLLKRGGLHRQMEDGQWALTEPSPEDPLNLKPTWEAISRFIFVSPPEIRPVEELYTQLKSPPFGITEGVLPLLLCAFLRVHQAQTTLYREGTLLAEPSVPDWEVLLRRPDLFAVAGCRVNGTRAAIVERIARGLKTSPNVMPVVRELVRQLRSLPEYAWKTNHLSPEAIALRHAIEQAHSPEKLLFSDLPAALSLPPIREDVLDENALEEFFQRLNKALSELATATPRRRDWARDTFLRACELPEGYEGWQAFIEICREMAIYVRHPNLIPLVKRAAEAEDPTIALDSVLALIANRPLRTWSDSDVNRFPLLAQSLGQLFLAERNGYLPELILSKEERQRSELISQELYQQIQAYHENSRILQAALQKLLSRFRSENEM